MPETPEARRRAIAAALRTEALQGRVERLSHRLDDVRARLSSVEMALLESVLLEPAVPASAVSVPGAFGDDDDEAAAAVSVPEVPLTEGRLSPVASRVLFGE